MIKSMMYLLIISRVFDRICYNILQTACVAVVTEGTGGKIIACCTASGLSLLINLEEEKSLAAVKVKGQFTTFNYVLKMIMTNRSLCGRNNRRCHNNCSCKVCVTKL